MSAGHGHSEQSGYRRDRLPGVDAEPGDWQAWQASIFADTIPPIQYSKGMNKQLVWSKDGNLYLDTGMPQSAFSKARVTDHLEERGLRAERTESGNAESWAFSKWSFTGTKLSEKNVLLEGPLFSGLPLSSFFEAGGTEKEHLAGARVCSAMEAALDQGLSLPRVGAGGIFISADFERVLFLPEGLFETASRCAEETLGNEAQAFYVNRLLTGDAAGGFTQAVIAYRLLLGQLPFPEDNEERREEDIHDRNYVPVARRIWGLDGELAQRIDQNLQRGASVRNGGNRDERLSHIVTEGAERNGGAAPFRRAGTGFPIKSLYRELGLTELGNIAPDGNLISVIHKSNISQEEFERRSEKELRSFRAALSKKRWVRRHRTLLTVLAVALFALALVAGICIETSMTRPTTQGLTEIQTTELFYSAFNTMDILSANASATGKNAGAVIDAMGAYFVSSKTRESYQSGSRVNSPAEWLSFNNGGTFSMYGISQFFIGNKKGEIFFTTAAKKDAPPPVTESGGVLLKKGTVKKLEVSYYFIYCIGSEQGDAENVEVLKKNDTLTLTYQGKRWQITDLEQHEGESYSVDKAVLYADYKAAFDACGQDSVKAADAIRAKYVWLPLGSEILEGIEKIKADYS